MNKMMYEHLCIILIHTKRKTVTNIIYKNAQAANNNEAKKNFANSSPYLMAEQKQDYEEKRNPDDYINQLTVYVVQGRNLPKYDIGPNAKSDPYGLSSAFQATFRYSQPQSR